MRQAHRLSAIRAATGDQGRVKTKVKWQKTKLKGLFYPKRGNLQVKREKKVTY